MNFYFQSPETWASMGIDFVSFTGTCYQWVIVSGTKMLRERWMNEMQVMFYLLKSIVQWLAIAAVCGFFPYFKHFLK